MDQWSAFSDYLAIDWIDQSWDDHECLHADDLIRSFTDADWRLLAAEWFAKHEKWQLRCAGVLASACDDAAILVLMDMVQKGADVVARCAADALRALLGDRSIDAPAAVIERVAQLKRDATGLMLRSLTQLEQRLIA